jgi:hypothetical protein
MNPSVVAAALWAVYLGVKAEIDRPQAGCYNIREKLSNFRKESSNSGRVTDSRDLLPGVARKRGNAGLVNKSVGIFQLTTYTLHAAIRVFLPVIRRFPANS